MPPAVSDGTAIFDRRARFQQHTWYDNPSADNFSQSKRHPESSPPAFPVLSLIHI